MNEEMDQPTKLHLQLVKAHRMMNENDDSELQPFVDVVWLLDPFLHRLTIATYEFGGCYTYDSCCPIDRGCM